MTRPGVRQAEALMNRFGLSEEHLIGVRFAINVGLATTIVWNTLRILGIGNPIWAIASMVAASDPQPSEVRRLFRSRLINVAVGCAAGILFIALGGTEDWVLPLALSATVLVSTYVVRIRTMWRQAPITAAVVIASALMTDSAAGGMLQGVRKVAEVIFGCLVGMLVSVVMSRVWLIQSSDDETGAA